MTFSSLRSKSPALFLLLGLSIAVPSAYSQTLTVTGGQGQLLTPLQQSQALTVKLLDPSGNPIAGALITFTQTDILGLYINGNSQTGITDATGTAVTYIYGAGLVTGQSAPFDSTTVTANYAGIAF